MITVMVVLRNKGWNFWHTTASSHHRLWAFALPTDVKRLSKPRYPVSVTHDKYFGKWQSSFVEAMSSTVLIIHVLVRVIHNDGRGTSVYNCNMKKGLLNYLFTNSAFNLKYGKKKSQTCKITNSIICLKTYYRYR